MTTASHSARARLANKQRVGSRGLHVISTQYVSRGRGPQLKKNKRQQINEKHEKRLSKLKTYAEGLKRELGKEKMSHNELPIVVKLEPPFVGDNLTIDPQNPQYHTHINNLDDIVKLSHSENAHQHLPLHLWELLSMYVPINPELLSNNYKPKSHSRT